jgi:MoxR-like ATPase
MIRPAPLEGDLPLVQQVASAIAQLDSVIIGKARAVRLAVACALARGHLLIEDVPGVGKTTLAHALAATLGLPFSRVQFTSDLLPADVIGASVYDAGEGRFRFIPGPVFTSVLLADEINRAPPKTQSALLEAMEERQVTVDGETRALPEPFLVIATQNPTEQLGAYPLPESQLDRFLVAVELGYPDPVAERALLAGGERRSRIAALRPIADAARIREWQQAAASIHVSGALLDYVQALLAATRSVDTTQHGLSPRAGLNLLAVSRAWALTAGRAMVLPEDVQAVFGAVAGHRLGGSVRSGAAMAAAILPRVPVP